MRRMRSSLSFQRHGEDEGSRLLSDGPPGIGCPVIASITGADIVLIVAEPTVSGVHDMERALDLASRLDVPTLVLINKADLNTEQTRRIERIAAEHSSPVIAHVPFDTAVHDALMAGRSVVTDPTGPAAESLRAAWKAVEVALVDIAARGATGAVKKIRVPSA